MSNEYVDVQSLDTEALRGLGRFVSGQMSGPEPKVFRGPVAARRLLPARRSTRGFATPMALVPGMPGYPNTPGLAGFNLGNFFSSIGNAIPQILSVAAPIVGGILGGPIGGAAGTAVGGVIRPTGINGAASGGGVGGVIGTIPEIQAAGPYYTGQASTAASAYVSPAASPSPTTDPWTLVDKLLATVKGSATANTPAPAPAPASSLMSGNTPLILGGIAAVGLVVLFASRK